MKQKPLNARTSNAQGKRRRKQILLAAGKVFASKGYEGAGIREIACACETPPSALLYHFGSKENLFVETLRFHIVQNAKLEHLYDSFIKADPQNPQTISDAILETVRNLLKVCHGPSGRVSCLNGLLVCMLNDSRLGVNHMFHQVGDGIIRHVKEVIMKFNPSFTETDYFWWRQLFWAQFFYPVVGQLSWRSDAKIRRYSPEFLDSMAWRLTWNCCISLGLPRPSGKDDWVIDERSA